MVFVKLFLLITFVIACNGHQSSADTFKGFMNGVNSLSKAEDAGRDQDGGKAALTTHLNPQVRERLAENLAFTYLGDVGTKQIYMEDALMTWTEAHLHCNKFALKLIRIESDEEQTFLRLRLPSGYQTDNQFWTSAADFIQNDVEYRGGEGIIRAYNWTSFEEGASRPKFEGSEIRLPNDPGMTSYGTISTATATCLVIQVLENLRFDWDVRFCSGRNKVLCQYQE